MRAAGSPRRAAAASAASAARRASAFSPASGSFRRGDTISQFLQSLNKHDTGWAKGASSEDHTTPPSSRTAFVSVSGQDGASGPYNPTQPDTTRHTYGSYSARCYHRSCSVGWLLLPNSWTEVSGRSRRHKAVRHREASTKPNRQPR